MNPILATDSYKLSHWKQYPPGTSNLFSYIEARGGKYPLTVFFGLQAIIMKHLLTPITLDDVLQAKELFELHQMPFNMKGWLKVVNEHHGYIPVRICAVREGMAVPTGNVLVTVELTRPDPELFWLVSYIETFLLRVWYPTTVATKSFLAKRVIASALDVSANDRSGLPFKLYDFGARGAACSEAAEMGGMGHLVNFKGSDTIEAIAAIREYYPDPLIPMSAYSIPAGEHSTYASWGRDREVDAYRNMLEVYGGKGKLLAAVSDSYDIYNAVENIWGGVLRDQVIESGTTVVIRPDSGDPHEVIPRLLYILDDKFGHDLNSKGYKVLKHMRIIWGDGISDHGVIEGILRAVLREYYSADNVTFGMGGGLLQKVDRDTLSFAMKASAVLIDGEWRDVYKDPVTQPGKKSKRGRLALVFGSVGHKTIRESELLHPAFNRLEPVYENGKLLRKMTLGAVRDNAEAGLSQILETSVTEQRAA
jgi:nicotinamide phosphoribosyltransferase